MFQKRSLVLLLAALAAASGCSDEKDPVSVGGEGGSGGSGGGGTGGTVPRPAGPELGARESLGAFLPAQPKALLVGVEKPLLLVGTQGIAFDPAWFGRPRRSSGVDPRSTEMDISSGLLTVDTSTGAARVLGKDDGLPTAFYADVGTDYGDYAASIVDLDWIAPDQTFAGAAWNALLKGTLGTDGTWSFESRTLRAPDAAQDAVVFHVATADGTIYAGGDQGLAIVSADTLEVQGWADFGAPGRTIHGLSAGLLGGERVAAVLIGEPEAAGPSAVGLLHADGTWQPFELPQGYRPTTALVLEQRVLVGVQTPDKLGAIFAWEQKDGGWQLEMQASPILLVTDGNRHGVVPNVLFYDRFRAELVVGGRIVEFAPGGPGGGIVTLSYTPANGIGSRASDLIVKQDPAFGELPWWVDAIAQDAQGNLYVAGRQLCSEHKARQLPVLKIERENAETVRLVRPFVDGVRSIAIDPKNGETWLGLRSELPGLSCDGLAVSQALCRLRADGSCQITTPEVNVNADQYAATPGVVEVAFGDPEKNAVALATLRDATFVQMNGSTRALATQFEPGLNLRHTSAAWGDDDTLWIGSIMEWDDFYEDERVNHRGPHGLGWMKINEVGIPKEMKRYVRVESDNQPDVDVGGLPSNMVYDVLPLPGAGKAVVALGVERGAVSYDHIPGDALADTKSKGGIALVDGETITVLDAPEGSGMDEIVALARGGADDAIYALDANEGIFVVDAEAKTAKLWTRATWGEQEIALSLAVDASGHVAVGTTRGLHVFGADTGVTSAIADMAAGYVWSVQFVADGVLYAGTDEGLQRIAIGAAELPAKGPAKLARWPFPVDARWCNGEGCACVADTQCGYASSCACTIVGGSRVCACAPQDLCAAQPGGFQCACEPAASGSCEDQFVCTTDEAGASSCQLPPAEECGGVAGCRCGVLEPCAEGFECNFAIRVCEALPENACLADCSCFGEGSTADGCMDGWSCHPAGLGRRECMEDGPDACEADCSCSDEGATGDGCHEGQECAIGPRGSSCVEALGCESDCSCTGPDTENGCPTGVECVEDPSGSYCDLPIGI